MNEDTNYVTTREACKLFNVSVVTLRKWDQDGKIQTFRTPGNQRRYSKRLLEEIDIRDSPPTLGGDDGGFGGDCFLDLSDG